MTESAEVNGTTEAVGAASEPRKEDEWFLEREVFLILFVLVLFSLTLILVTAGVVCCYFKKKMRKERQVGCETMQQQTEQSHSPRTSPSSREPTPDEASRKTSIIIPQVAVHEAEVVDTQSEHECSKVASRDSRPRTRSEIIADIWHRFGRQYSRHTDDSGVIKPVRKHTSLRTATPEVAPVS